MNATLKTIHRLAIFDVDGTLVDHGRLEGDFYVEALRHVFGWREIDVNWSSYRHATDGGILQEMHEARCGRRANADQVAAVRRRFLANYQAGVERQPGEMRVVTGAGAMLAELPDWGWRLAIATGAWNDLARFKLATVGLACAGLPAATGDNAEERVAIMELAINAARQYYGIEQFDHIVYVGDGIWDINAARALRMPFVGIGKRCRELRAAGASHTFADFADLPAFRQALLDCSVPA